MGESDGAFARVFARKDVPDEFALSFPVVGFFAAFG
jgi:hypothetical protein